MANTEKMESTIFRNRQYLRELLGKMVVAAVAGQLLGMTDTCCESMFRSVDPYSHHSGWRQVLDDGAAFAHLRVAQGVDVHGKTLVIVDDWSKGGNAHRLFALPWTGITSFWTASSAKALEGPLAAGDAAASSAAASPSGIVMPEHQKQ